MNRLQKGIGIVGSTTIDRIVDEHQSIFKLGGVTTYAGITYRRHGIPCYIVSNLAEEDLSIQAKLREEGVVVLAGATDQTTHFVNYIQGDQRRQELRQQAGPVGTAQIQALLNRVDGLHLGPLHPDDIELDALHSLQNSGPAIFLDVQGFTRAVKDHKIYPAVSADITTGLTLARIVKANGAEYQAILDFFQLPLANLMQRFNIDEFAVTSGKMGGSYKPEAAKPSIMRPQRFHPGLIRPAPAMCFLRPTFWPGGRFKKGFRMPAVMPPI